MTPLDNPRDMRRPATWMRDPDERLLEVLATDGNMTPKGASKDGKVERAPIGAGYAGKRLRKLMRAGFVTEVDDSLYGISEQGRRFLSGEFDASDVPDPDEEASDSI